MRPTPFTRWSLRHAPYHRRHRRATIGISKTGSSPRARGWSCRKVAHYTRIARGVIDTLLDGAGEPGDDDHKDDSLSRALDAYRPSPTHVSGPMPPLELLPRTCQPYKF